MTDIRKDFEKWARCQRLPVKISDSFINKGAYANPDTHVAFLGYQAGRAHGVDELIAEILNYVAAENEDDDCTISIQTVIPIIRKHFERDMNPPHNYQKEV